MKYIKAIIGVLVLVCLDQVTKHLVLEHLTLHQYYPVFGDVFGLFYLENKGTAWGMFQNCQIVFLILTVIILIFAGFIYVRLLKNRQFLPLNICIVFLVSGAIGNMIDRIFHGSVLFQGAVVDFLYFKLINFPVFNVADIYVTMSGLAIILLIAFKYRDTDFHFLLSKKQEKESDTAEIK